jgi:hypothetical protein
MESLQKQIISLSDQVDALYQVVEQLTVKVSDALSECQLTPIEMNKSLEEDSISYNQAQVRSSLKPAMSHKDILADDTYLNRQRQSGEELMPELQIQRLMAQLTVAYNRIAALEEQLFTQRINRQM